MSVDIYDLVYDAGILFCYVMLLIVLKALCFLWHAYIRNNLLNVLGISQEIGLYRNGRRIENMTDDINYDYDNPMFYQ